jgi:hypothetical protein
MRLMCQVIFKNLKFKVYFATYEKLKLFFKSSFKFENKNTMPFYINLVSASIASIISSIITTPLDLVKTRIQVNDNNFKPYKGIISTFGRIIKEEGFSALFLGIKPRILWLASGTTLSMVIYEEMKKYLK